MAFPFQSPTPTQRPPIPAATPDALDKLLDDVPDAPKTPTQTRTAPVTPDVGNSRTKALEDFARSNGFEPSDGFATSGHNRGSKHYSGYALDVHVKDRKPEEVDGFIQKAKEAGYIVRDERVRPAGQAVWKGPHVHLEYDGLDQLLSDLPDEQSQQNIIDTPIAPNRQRDSFQQPTTTPQINLRRSAGAQAGQVVGEAVNQTQSQEQAAVPSQAKFTPNVNYTQAPFDLNRLAPMSPAEASEAYLRHFGSSPPYGLTDKYLDAFVAQAIKEGGADFTYTQGEKKGQQISREDFEAIKKTGFNGVGVRDSVKKLAQDYLKAQSSPAMESNDLGVYERNRQKVSDYIDEHTPKVVGDLLTNAQNAVNTDEGVKLRNPPTQLTPDDKEKLVAQLKTDAATNPAMRVLGQTGEHLLSGVATKVGNVLGFLKFAPESADILRRQGLALEIASETDHAKDDVAGYVERGARAVLNAGVDIGELILTREATGADLPTILVAHSVTQNLDKDEGTQLKSAAQAYVFGNILESIGGIGRLRSMGLFGVGEPSLAYAEGERRPKELFARGVGGLAMGGLLGGGEEADNERAQERSGDIKARRAREKAADRAAEDLDTNIYSDLYVEDLPFESQSQAYHKAREQYGKLFAAHQRAVADIVLDPSVKIGANDRLAFWRAPERMKQLAEQFPDVAAKYATAEAAPVPETSTEATTAQARPIVEDNPSDRFQERVQIGDVVLTRAELTRRLVNAGLSPDTAWRQVSQRNTVNKELSPYEIRQAYIEGSGEGSTSKPLTTETRLARIATTNEETETLLKKTLGAYVPNVPYEQQPAEYRAIFQQYQKAASEQMRAIADVVLDPSVQIKTDDVLAYWREPEQMATLVQWNPDIAAKYATGGEDSAGRVIAERQAESGAGKEESKSVAGGSEVSSPEPAPVQKYKVGDKVVITDPQTGVEYEGTVERVGGRYGVQRGEVRIGERNVAKVELSDPEIVRPWTTDNPARVERDTFEELKAATRRVAERGQDGTVKLKADATPEDVQAFKDIAAEHEQAVKGDMFATRAAQDIFDFAKRIDNEASKASDSKTNQSSQRGGAVRVGGETGIRETAETSLSESGAKAESTAGEIEHHSQTQARRQRNTETGTKGQFKEETKAQREARLIDHQRYQETMTRNGPEYGIENEADIPSPEEAYQTFKDEYAAVKTSIAEYEAQLQSGKRLRESARRSLEAKAGGARERLAYLGEHAENLFGERAAKEITGKVARETKQLPTTINTPRPEGRQVEARQEGRYPKGETRGAFGQGEEGASPQLIEAYKAWTENRAYVDGAGNYHVRPESATPTRSQRGPIAPWNKAVKRAFKDSAEFHRAAQEYAATPKEGEGRSEQPQASRGSDAETRSLLSEPTIQRTPQPVAVETNISRPTVEATPKGTTGEVAPAPRVTGAKERSFPKSAEAVGMEGGADRYYEGITNKETVERAQANIQSKGADRVAADIARKDEASADDIASGVVLMRQFTSKGDVDRAVDVASDLSRKLTKAGQTVQAASIVSGLSDEGVLVYGQRLVEGKKSGAKLTNEQADTLIEAARKAREADGKIADLEKQIEALKAKSQPKPTTKLSTLGERLSQIEAEARARMAARKEQAQAVISNKQAGATTIIPDLADIAIIGATKFARKGVTVASWSTEMIKEFGEEIKPHLRKLYRDSFQRYDSERKAMLRESRERAVKRENPNVSDAREIRKLVNQKLDAQTEARRAKQGLQREFNNLTRTRAERVVRGAADVLGLTRALQTTLDLSAGLRQGKIGLARHPFIWTKAFVKQFPAMRGQQYDRMVSEFESDVDYKDSKKSGLYLSSLAKEAGLAGHEEAFMSHYAEKIPLVKQSERAYTMMLDQLRMGWFKHYAKGLKKMGFDIDTPEGLKAYKEGAQLINDATGRGSLGRMENSQAATLANNLFFSPRFWASRVRLLTVTPAKILLPESAGGFSKPARVEAFKTLFAFTTLVATNLAIARMTGAAVDLNPDSPDFLKGKWGRMRIDFSAGFQGHIRLALRVARHIYETKVEGVKPTSNFKDIGGKYLRGKLAPNAALLYDVFGSDKTEGENLKPSEKGYGTDFVGKPVYPFGDPKEKTVLGRVRTSRFARFTPMVIQDAKEAYDEMGWGAGLSAATASFFGEGVNTYDDKEKSRGRRSPLPPIPHRR